MFRKVGLSVATLVLLVGPAPALAAASQESCAVTWGSGVKSTDGTVFGEMIGLRAGRQSCFDRLVFDFPSSVDGYWVSYVNQVYEPTYVFDDPAELVDVTGFQTFRQVAWAGTHHGTTTVGLGVRARLPFRVFTLPNRIVVDVAHQW